MVATSAVSFAFVALFFHLALSLPSRRAGSPEDDGILTACVRSGGQQPAVTELGRLLPVGRVRATVSLPAFFDVATLLSLHTWLVAGELTRVPRVHGLVQYAIAAAMVPPFLMVQAMPTDVDPLIIFGMLNLTVAVEAFCLVRPRESPGQLVARCPTLLFVASGAVLFGFAGVLNTSLAKIGKLGIEPGLVVCAAIILVRVVGFAARQVLKGLEIPSIALFAMLFAYDVDMLVALRRYWLSLPGLGDVAASALVSGVVELSCNFMAASYAISTYNALVERGQTEKATVQINTFFTAIVSDLVAEHVALHGSLAYNLFVDPRVLSVAIAPKGAQVFEAWALAFAVEIVTDVLTAIPMILFLPVSLRQLFSRCWHSWPATIFIACACMHPHLMGLHTYVDYDRYLCG